MHVINKSSYNSDSDPLFKFCILKIEVVLFMHDYEMRKLPNSFTNFLPI